MNHDSRYSMFLEKCSAALGADLVLPQSAAESTYGVNEIGVKRVIPGAVRPRTQSQVVSLLQIARDSGVPLYPISTGNNWGYGGANPVSDGCVIVDLSGMNRIVEMDAESGLITLEPGVTQRQLRAYLDANGLPFLCPVSGAGPDCSLIGNALERGYGITPYADHFLAVMAIQAVLPNGSIYRTPLTELGGVTIDRAFKWGVGPYLDGIFTQGNFGIVTEMTIALAAIPERVEALFFGVPRDEDLELAVIAVRSALREVGGVVGSINLMNMRRVLSMMEPYPRDQIGTEGIIPTAHLLKMAKRSQVMPWMGAGALYGNAKVVKAAKSVVRARLRGVAKRLMFFTPNSVQVFAKASRAVPGALGTGIRNVFTTLNKTLQLLAGAPSEIALPLSYWVSGTMPATGQPMHPARDGCGLLWYSPLVPMQPERVRAYVEMVEAICRRNRVEPLITLTSLSDRCYDSTVPLLFDRTSDEAIARTHRCYDELFDAGRKLGFVPYRTSVATMPLFVRDDSTYWKLVRDLKAAVDPARIIAPGRYDGYQRGAKSSG